MSETHTIFWMLWQELVDDLVIGFVARGLCEEVLDILEGEDGIAIREATFERALKKQVCVKNVKKEDVPAELERRVVY
jgi:hypothetical protein